MMNKQTDNTKIIAVVGPTASGKSDLALNIAGRFNGEIVSCDSMQIYRGMDIGTAKPTKQDMLTIRHHMIDICNIDTPFSVADYVKGAKACMADISLRGKTSVFCGGTGLYIDSLVNGTDFGEFENLPEYREELEQQAKQYGNKYLLDKLSELDAQYAKKLSSSDLKRIIRGLEICKSSGKNVTDYLKSSKSHTSGIQALYIGLYYENRELLYQRINNRVDLMVSQGLLDEAKQLYQNGIESCPTAGQAIGYKEFYPYFKGTDSLCSCIEKLKQNSRHYAKRQLTWFRRNKNILWLACDGDDAQSKERKAFDAVNSFLASD